MTKSNYEWVLKKKWKNHGPTLMQAVFQVGDHFWGRGNRCPKNWKTIFFKHILYSLKAHGHYFKIWRGAKLGISTRFTFTNLTRCSQIINSLVYGYSTQIPGWSQSWSHFFVLPPRKIIFSITTWWVFVFYLGISTTKGSVSTRSGKSGNLLEDQEKSEKFD